MCGIAGILTSDGATPSRAALEAMTARLAHRGPDGEGALVLPGAGLGHRRLNVIDIEGGAQPMANEDNTVFVTFNGEIYNHDALRAELVAFGHIFHSRCDTEVLVHGYEQWGVDLLVRLEGMFAFAIWDSKAQRALLARDRMGQKPLFYASLPDGRLLFGSEAKALVAHPDLNSAVDPRALATYLTFEYLPGTLSMFAGVHKLEPGCGLVYEEGALETFSYWDIPFGAPWEGGSPARALRDALDRAVDRRLMADVPLGVFLSGGIDSSAIAALVCRHRDPASVKTFSIAFDDPSFDESNYARLVAQHLGTDHHERRFTANRMLDTLPKVAAILDEPFGDASLLPTYLLSAFTRETVTVALGGDGGDELLMGYPTFKADLPAVLYRRLPTTLRRILERQVARLPVDTRNFSLDFVVKSFLRAAAAEPSERHPLWLGSFLPDSSDNPLHPDLRRQFGAESVLEVARRAFESAPAQSRLQRLSYQYCKTYLAEDILVKVDRASMAVSLEARSPFLDSEVVSLAARMPARYKLRGQFQAKHVLKQAVGELLPPVISKRKKKGFGIPVAEWFKGPLKGQLLDLLDPARIKRAGYLRPEVVSRLVEEHLRGRRDNRKMLWTLFSFELWRDQYGIGGR